MTFLQGLRYIAVMINVGSRRYLKQKNVTSGFGRAIV